MFKGPKERRIAAKTVTTETLMPVMKLNSTGMPQLLLWMDPLFVSFVSDPFLIHIPLDAFYRLAIATGRPIRSRTVQVGIVRTGIPVHQQSWSHGICTSRELSLEAGKCSDDTTQSTPARLQRHRVPHQPSSSLDPLSSARRSSQYASRIKKEVEADAYYVTMIDCYVRCKEY